jgi:hypothetical protein
MATAPRPGSITRKRSKRAGFRVTIGPDVHVLRTADLGPGDDHMVRRITGRPLSQYLTADTFGLDSVAVIIWMARRKAGEKRLTLQRVMDEMPSFEEIDELTENDEFELEQLEDLDELPPGDVLDLDGEEVAPDPLGSAGT